MPGRTDTTKRSHHRPGSVVLVAVLAVLVGMFGGVAGGSTVWAEEPPPSTTTTVAPTTTTTTTVRPTTTTTTAVADTTTTTESTTTTSTIPTTSTTAGPVVPYQPPRPLSPTRAAQLQALLNQYDDLTAQEQDLLARYLTLQDQSDSLRQQLEDLTDSIAQGERDLAVAQAKIETAETHAQDVGLRLQDADDRLTDEQDILRAQAVEAYVGGGMGGSSAATNALLKSTNVDDVGKTLVYADAVIGDQRKSVERVAELHRQVLALEADAEAARVAAVQGRDELQAREDALKLQRDQQAELKRQVDENAALTQLVGVQVSAKKDEYAARISAMQQVSGGIQGTLASRQVGQSLPAGQKGFFLPPIPGGRIVSGFGPRLDPVSGQSVSVHQGIDISASMGTPIRASADGIVVIASEQGGYGNCTVIDHGNGLGTLYGHQSAFNVQVGDKVTRGQIIGLVGSTGNSTGPHLHWEVRVFGEPIDPVSFLGAG